MQNVKLQVGITIQISELIDATVVVSGRSIEDVTRMIHKDYMHPTQTRNFMLDLQRCYWRVGDWFDDALKHLLICNRLTRLIIVADE